MLPIAARSPAPAKRCDRPQSFSASAAGRCRLSMSSRTSMAAASRPPSRISVIPIPVCPYRALLTHHRKSGIHKSANSAVRAPIPAAGSTGSARRDARPGRRRCRAPRLRPGNRPPHRRGARAHCRERCRSTGGRRPSSSNTSATSARIIAVPSPCPGCAMATRLTSVTLLRRRPVAQEREADRLALRARRRNRHGARRRAPRDAGRPPSGRPARRSLRGARSP